MIESLERTLEPDESITLPLWALDSSATMRMKRASSVRWDGLISPILPAAPTASSSAASPAVPLDVSSATKQSPGTLPKLSPSTNRGSGSPSKAAGGAGGDSAASTATNTTTITGSGGQRMLKVRGMEFFDLALSTTPLIDPTSDGETLRSLSDTTIDVAWRAKLQNILPVDIELLAGGDDGAMDGAMRSRRLGAPICSIVPSGKHAELPVDELAELSPVCVHGLLQRSTLLCRRPQLSTGSDLARARTLARARALGLSSDDSRIRLSLSRSLALSVSIAIHLPPHANPPPRPVAVVSMEVVSAPGASARSARAE